jgi:hypothetical protein
MTGFAPAENVGAVAVQSMVMGSDPCDGFVFEQERMMIDEMMVRIITKMNEMSRFVSPG